MEMHISDIVYQGFYDVSPALMEGIVRQSLQSRKRTWERTWINVQVWPNITSNHVLLNE